MGFHQELVLKQEIIFKEWDSRKCVKRTKIHLGTKPVHLSVPLQVPIYFPISPFCSPIQNNYVSKGSFRTEELICSS